MREIEKDTLLENPPLFREYISASPDVRFIMDTQFKNVKTHARLLSRAMWYEWRMKLLEGLREGLVKINDGMDADDAVLGQQEALLEPVVPALVQEKERLEQRHAELRSRAEELADCDQEELKEARERLVRADDAIAENKRTLAALQAQLQEKAAGLQAAAETKATYLEKIQEAERIREECRGWSSREVAALRGMLGLNGITGAMLTDDAGKVEAMEREHGWMIAAAAGTSLKMEFRGEVQLAFDAASFRSNEPGSTARKGDDSPIEAAYIGGRHEHEAKEITPVQHFFVQSINATVQSLVQRETRVKDLLDLVSACWAKCTAVGEETRQLNLRWPTMAAPRTGMTLEVESALLLPELATKVAVVFDVAVEQPKAASVAVEVRPRARVVYGERFNEGKMGEYLAGQVEDTVAGAPGEQRGSWGQAVESLGEKLKARGKK